MITLFSAIFETPEENLAADEALLEASESNGGMGFLRFWESPVPFVVLGYGKQLDREVFREVCERRGIPVLRRCSGGGTVLQGPGCCNYTLILPIDHSVELETITGANRYIMERVRASVEAVANGSIEIKGHTDLVYNGRKFSGNAQRRKRSSLIFHGCFLIDFDLSLITETLRLPEQQPEYRAARSHSDFLTNLPLNRAALQERFAADWKAAANTEAALISARVTELARGKYGRRDWNEGGASASRAG